MGKSSKKAPLSTLKTLSLKKGQPVLSKGRPMQQSNSHKTGWTRPRNQWG